VRLLFAALLLTAAASPARADHHVDQAKKLFDDGNAKLEAGEFDAAIGAFQQAYQLSPRPGILYAIAQAASAAMQPELALRSFEQYLAADPNTAKRAMVEARIVQLKKAIERQRAVAIAPPLAPAPAVAPTTAPPAAELVASPTPRATPLTHKAWFWGTVAGAAIVIGGGIALGVTLGGGTRYPTPTGQAHVE
jgi:tetratricopeptide (TPR) repeat protein